MKSKVYGITMRASDKENLLQKIGRLLDTLNLGQAIGKRDLVALKLHFGERGNTTFIRPVLLRPVVEKVAALGAFPFLTDANTLYVGMRSNAIEHLRCAVENGFAFSSLGAPITIADGLKGTSYKEVPLNLEYIKTAYVASDVAEADVLISLAHFKLHEVSGLGGAMKNVGMGAAARRGKMEQHSGINPKVKRKLCIGCGQCLDHCAHQAISLIDAEGEDKAFIDPKKCVGCAECVRVCPQGAVMVQWSKEGPVMMKKMVEYTLACLEGKKDRSFFVNFLTQIIPACDCHPSADAPMVRDIGILASTDPVAVDKASVDLMNQEPALAGTCLGPECGAGSDKIKAVYPHIDWECQFDHAEKIGLGSTDYDLEWLPEKL